MSLIDCSSLEGQLIALAAVGLLTLVIEALIGHLALKRKIPAGSTLGLFTLGLFMVFLWAYHKFKKGESK
jgi:hypothetical protein